MNALMRDPRVCLHCVNAVEISRKKGISSELSQSLGRRFVGLLPKQVKLL